MTYTVNKYQTREEMAAEIETHLATISSGGGGGGADGDSAYQIWLDEGNSGTAQDFLDALVGAQGSQGAQGAQGAQGVQGIQGEQGQAPAFSMDIIELTQGTMQQHDSTADLAIEWKTQDATNTNFTHSTSTNPEQITCVNAGWLDVRYAIMYDQDDTARLNTEAYITLNGVRVEKSTSRKTYYRGLAYGKYGDESRAFYLQVSADDVIELHSGVTDGNDTFTLTRAIDTIPSITNIQIRYLG